MKKINVLVDASSYVHKTYHAFDPMLDKKNKDQRVLHGILFNLRKIVYEIDRIDNLFLIFDPEDSRLYRESIFSEYKANRKEEEEELKRQQKDAIHILKNHIGIPIIHYNGYEADDIIGSMIKHLLKNDDEVLIVSPDKDMAQLVRKNVKMIKPVKNKKFKGFMHLDEERVELEFGVKPNQIADMLALMGDTADNIPGIENVGEKTAIKILKDYMSIEHIIAFRKEINNKKLKEQIEKNIDLLPMMKKLTTIECGLNLENHIEDSFQLAEKIRTHEKYNENILKLSNFFNWHESYKDMFLL